MAFTNQSQHADDAAHAGTVGRRQRLKNKTSSESETSGKRRGSRARQRREAVRAAMDHGWPEWEGLKPVLFFLLAPALLVGGVILTGPWPKPVLYGFAALIGLYVIYSAFHTIELVLACFVLYLPFSTTFVVPVAPGVNATNMLILLGLFSVFMKGVGNKQGFMGWPRGTTSVALFAALSALSAFTVMRLPGGFSYLLYHELLNYKAWLDQFVLYIIALACIRDINMAKRMVIYMCIGHIFLVLYAIPEMIEKAGASTIEKSRLNGPHQQPNMFGGFVAYSFLPLVALFVMYIKDIRTWLITPVFLLSAKVLITTFSRGAYLAMAVGGFLTAYFKGKGFLFTWATLGLCTVLLFPSVLPQSILDRLNQSSVEDGSTTQKLDRSSEDRIILWRAAGKMIIESPIIGKGFNAFKRIKAEYTETPVPVSDPHNTYFYIATQMGIPTLSLFLFILLYSFHLGRKLSRNKEDLFIRAIGIGGASLTACYAIICVFGSRAVNLEFTAYFWVYFACMQVINQTIIDEGHGGGSNGRRNSSGKGAKRARGAAAFAAQQSAEGGAVSDSTSTSASKALTPTPSEGLDDAEPARELTPREKLLSKRRSSATVRSSRKRPNGGGRSS